MAQSSEHVWTQRFWLLVSLAIAGQIILGIIVYAVFGFTYPRTELVLTAVLLLCGVGVLGLLQEPVPRKIVLGAGSFLLVALLVLVSLSRLPMGIAGNQPFNSLRVQLSYWVVVCALLAFLGKVVTRNLTLPEEATDNWIEDVDQPASWFMRLCHLALAGIAGVELLLQMADGNRLLLLPFAIKLYGGFSLNSAAVLLLGLLLVCSLLRFKTPLSRFDSWLLLMLGIVCALFQYTFGSVAFVRLNPGMSQPASVGINLVLSLLPLALAIWALFSMWGRFFVPLWLAIQLLILQQFLGSPIIRAGAASALRPVASGQLLLYALVVALIMLVLRLLLYWDRRKLNVIDAIAVVLITLIVSLTMWSLGQRDFQQAQAVLATQQGINQLSLAYSLVVIADIIAIGVVLFVGLICALVFLRRRYPWLSRVESIVGSLLVLGITVGALLILNSVGNRSSALAAATLNLHALNVGLPAFAVSNLYILDGLFVVFLLIYVSALARQRWNRTFSHLERVLVILSGGVCLLALASQGKSSILPLVSANAQRVGASGQQIFTPGRIIATCLLLAALISLLWLNRSRNRTERITLLALFGCAAFCAFVYDLVAWPLLLILPPILLLAGVLIATKIELVKAAPAASPAGAENEQQVDNPVS